MEVRPESPIVYVSSLLCDRSWEEAVQDAPKRTSTIFVSHERIEVGHDFRLSRSVVESGLLRIKRKLEECVRGQIGADIAVLREVQRPTSSNKNCRGSDSSLSGMRLSIILFFKVLTCYS